jgi:oligopeptide/dipeptide ABC transporter ATP-binding protein
MVADALRAQVQGDAGGAVPLLSVRELQTEVADGKRRVVAVDGVSFDVGAGEIVGIVGESGCGKSMTALSIIGLLPPRTRIVGGSVQVNGRELVGLSESELCNVRGNEIGIVFQDPITSLNPTKRIGPQVAETLRLHRRWTAAQARARALEVLAAVGIPSPAKRYDSYPYQLSGGMRQRVMIAIAIACEPKILIADEPTTALDVTVQEQILALLDDLRQRLRMGIVVITHDFGVVASLADRIEVMYAARIVEEAATEVLFARRRHPYADALLKAIPRLHGERRPRLDAIAGMPPDLGSTFDACRFAPRCNRMRERCLDSEPSLEPAEDARHRFRCYFPLSDGGEARGG